MSDEHGSDFVDELMEFLLRNYYSMMIKRVKRFFPNKFDAEDIVTETIIVLLENKSAVAAHEAPIKWLQTTLTHRVKQNSRIAKRNSEMFVSLETLDESKLPSVPDAADDYCEYSDFPFETMLGIIASELSEKDAKNIQRCVRSQTRSRTSRCRVRHFPRSAPSKGTPCRNESASYCL